MPSLNTSCGHSNEASIRLATSLSSVPDRDQQSRSRWVSIVKSSEKVPAAAEHPLATPWAGDGQAPPCQPPPDAARPADGGPADGGPADGGPADAAGTDPSMPAPSMPTRAPATPATNSRPTTPTPRRRAIEPRRSRRKPSRPKPSRVKPSPREMAGTTGDSRRNFITSGSVGLREEPQSTARSTEPRPSRPSTC